MAPDQVEKHFTAAVRGLVPRGSRQPSGMVRDNSSLSAARCLELFDAQLASRHLDLAARLLQAEGAGFYTIGSSGHEGNAGLAAALRLTDPALLHYRSGAFYLVRAGQASPPRDGVNDVLLGLVAAAAEPISGGRHKVFGHPQLNVIPQTSTIASHLPRAVGVAFALARAAKLGMTTRWPDDAIVVCSFGDASANHCTATGAVNTAAYCSYQGLPLPLLLVCEDNGLGISVRTPPGWIEATQSGRPCVKYFHADGADLAAVYDTAVRAAAWVRERREPAFLHLQMVRFGGHAGSDVESSYRVASEIAADLGRPRSWRDTRRRESGCSRWPPMWPGHRGWTRPLRSWPRWRRGGLTRWPRMPSAPRRPRSAAARSSGGGPTRAANRGTCAWTRCTRAIATARKGCITSTRWTR